MKAAFGRLDRHILGRTVLITLMVALLLVTIVIAIDFLINIGAYTHGAKSGQTFQIMSLYWYRLPQLANMALPVAMVIGALLVCAPMLRRGEFIALSASGISPGRVALMIPLVAIGIGALDAYIADRITPRATVQTTRITDRMQNQDPVGRVWQVPATHTSWFIASAQGLIRGASPSVDRVVIASRTALVLADRMIWEQGQWHLHGHLSELQSQPDGTYQLLRPADVPLVGPLALPYNPLELYARLLPRDTMSSADLIRQGDISDTAYAWSRWARCVIPLLAVLVALPVFVRFLNRDNLIVGIGRALLAAATPVVVVVLGELAGEHSHPELVLPGAVLVALVPAIVLYWRWRL